MEPRFAKSKKNLIRETKRTWRLNTIISCSIRQVQWETCEAPVVPVWVEDSFTMRNTRREVSLFRGRRLRLFQEKGQFHFHLSPVLVACVVVSCAFKPMPAFLTFSEQRGSRGEAR